MGVLMYSPGIRVVISSAANGTIDVSEDIQSGTLTLNENMPSSFSFVLMNHRRKYDGVFTPNDIVAVRMKRLKWMPVFAGYLNQVPYFSVYPRSVNLTASDTLKRLKYRLWDSGAPESVELLNRNRDNEAQDGGMSTRIVDLLTEVAGWPKRNIHIGKIPDAWAAKTESLRETLLNNYEVDPSILGLVGIVGGEYPLSPGNPGSESIGPGTGNLPDMSGKITILGGAGTPGEMQLTGESRATPNDPWYLAMRWPYAIRSSDGTEPSGGMTNTEFQTAKRWWKDRKVLVVNRNNNKGVVLRAADWPQRGTAPIAMSRHAMRTILDAEADDIVDVRLADPNAPLGPLGEDVDKAGLSPWELDPLPATTPTVVNGSWTASDNLKPHTHAAQVFIKENWPSNRGVGGYRVSNIAGTGKVSDHQDGRALDIMTNSSGKVAQGVEVGLGNAIALWFVQNPNVFNTDYVIWMDRINSGTGWRSYKNSTGDLTNNTLQHRDHVHISFNKSTATEPGPIGGGWPGSKSTDMEGFILAGRGAEVPVGFAGGGVIGGSLPLSNAAVGTQFVSTESAMLTGPRALMNDTALLHTIDTLCKASMRSYMAAPNGDFIAWFPDYFGAYRTASKIEIKDIELAVEGFTIAWDDSQLVTHQYTAGAWYGSQAFGQEGLVDMFKQAVTHGIASVETPELMKALFNVDENDPRAASFLNPQAILQRFGARMNYKKMGYITGPQAEFWYACHLFQKNWAEQFSSKIDITFMPEIWPGMLVYLPTYQFQAYVEQVTHTFNFSEGGGFDTSVRVIAPSSTGGGLYAFPRGVHYQDDDSVPGKRRGGVTII